MLDHRKFENEFGKTDLIPDIAESSNNGKTESAFCANNNWENTRPGEIGKMWKEKNGRITNLKGLFPQFRQRQRRFIICF